MVYLLTVHNIVHDMYLWNDQSYINIITTFRLLTEQPDEIG